MPVCARAIQQPDGTFLLALDPAVQDFSTCPYLVDNGGSNAWRELGTMTIKDAQATSLAIGLVWATAWAFKTLGRQVSSRDSESE